MAIKQKLKSKNQWLLDFPEINQNQKWSIMNYLGGNSVKKCPWKFEDFDSITYIKQVGNYHHAITDTNHILVLAVIFKTK